MDTDPADKPPPMQVTSSASRMLILQSLVAIASNLTSAQLEAFTSRLTDALFKLPSQTVRRDQADLSLAMGEHLKKNGPMFCRAVANRINHLLFQEIHSINGAGQSKFGHEAKDLSLVSFDEMENKVLIGNISKAIELDNSEVLGVLNLRIANLLGHEEASLAQNPFRPAVFLQAVHDAWRELDSAVESQNLVLGLLRPDVFLKLAPILLALNDALTARGILPGLAKPYQCRTDNDRRSQASLEKQRGLPLYQKLQNSLRSTAKTKNEDGYRFGENRTDGDFSRRHQRSNADGVAIGPELLQYLSDFQRQRGEFRVDVGPVAVPQSAMVLRQISSQAPPGTLTDGDENTIELLAKIFDFVFNDKNLPSDIRGLIGGLQIPLLKAALSDKDFFFKEDHPARRLLDTLAISSVAWDQEKGRDDPLYKTIERIVERVQLEFEQQIELFSDAVSDLESFIAEEEQLSERALAEPIAQAMRQEKIQSARDLAEDDVAARIETGEVAGFVEVFLETQWTRILTMAHCVADSKPHVLGQARDTMDDLIWSLKPKTNQNERKELLTRLPAMLSMINAWLNMTKWNESERVLFFSHLSDRHAAIMRAPFELSQRRHVEMAVNAAQKASERELSTRARKMEQRPLDHFGHMVNGIERGEWVEFVRADGTKVKFKLAWVSPRRTQFIFTNRQGQGSFSFTEEELANTFRDQKATIVPRASMVDRALAAALDEIDVE
jgi:hypothetical protein